MPAWPRHPVIFEINAWIWLSELKRKYGGALTLENVPTAEWDRIAEFRVDAVWLMGVWERSPAGIAIANRNHRLIDDFYRDLPDFRPEDNVGSPYCVRGYTADRRFGGSRGLRLARSELAKRGIRLLLDFVPNHVAPDHSWVAENPDFFIQGTVDDLRADPASYLQIRDRIIACGRDPYFPAWPDVLQLNAFDRGLRVAARETLLDIASQCDGVRCDMAMLTMNAVVERVWGARAGKRPLTEYWADVIPGVKDIYPDFLFIAEAYWDSEWDLQHEGFDFCYDKRLYDRLQGADPEAIRLHLGAPARYQEKLVRFIENHDERRAAAVFSPAKQRAAATMVATLPGAKLFHEGQFDGRRIRSSVFLGRRPDEPPDQELRSFYRRLLEIIANPVFHCGKWDLCNLTGWPDNATSLRLMAWSWTRESDCFLVVFNFADGASQGRVHLPWHRVDNGNWLFTDMFSGVIYDRCGAELRNAGLYVDLAAWGVHLFQCRRLLMTTR